MPSRVCDSAATSGSTGRRLPPRSTSSVSQEADRDENQVFIVSAPDERNIETITIEEALAHASLITGSYDPTPASLGLVIYDDFHDFFVPVVGQRRWGAS